MKKFIRMTTACTAAALVLTAFTGCNGARKVANDPTSWDSLQNNDIVTITFAGRDVDTEKVNYQAFIDEFNNTHDNIIVNLDWTSDTTAYNTALDGADTDLPDVFMLSQMMFMRYAASGKIASISDHVDPTLIGSLYDTAFDVFYYDSATHKIGPSENAELYGLPKDMGPQQVAVNRDLLKQAVSQYNADNPTDMLDINRIMSATNPMDFDEFVEIGTKLREGLNKVKDGAVVLVGLNQQSAVYSNNANYFTVGDDGHWQAAIDSPNFVGAIQFIQNCYKAGLAPDQGTVSNPEQKFTTGEAIFYGSTGPHLTKDWWNINQFDWDLIPVPMGTAEGAMSVAQVGGMAYAISAYSPYKDAALELATYLATNSTSQRTQYSRGQCIPNLKALGDEFSNDSQGLIAMQSGKTNPAPSQRGVWIDTVNGMGDSDKVGGKYGIESYTLDEVWLSTFKNWIGGTEGTGNPGSIYKAKEDGTWVDVEASLKAFKNTLQGLFDASFDLFSGI